MQRDVIMKTKTKKLISNTSMWFAVFCMIFASASPGFAAAKKANKSKVNQCIKAVDKKAKKMGKKLPGIIHEAAQRMCWVSEDKETGLGILSSISVEGLEKALTEGNEIIIGRGYSRKISEPGLLGMKGAHEVLIKLLEDEAKALWEASASLGGPPMPEGATTTKVENKNEIIINLNDSLEDNYFTEYKKIHLAALKNDPGSVISIKLRMYLKLKEIALKPASQRSKDEKDYLKSFEDYVQSQYIRMTQAALDKFEAWEEENEKRAIDTGMSGLFHIGTKPPDFKAHMAGAIALSTGAAATAIALGVAGSVQKTAIAGSLGVLGEGAKLLPTAGKALSVCCGVGFQAFHLLAPGPLAIITASIVFLIMATDGVIKQETARSELTKAVKKAKGMKVSAKGLLATREGTLQAQHFFAKMTSSSSPDGYEDPAEGCQACYFANKEYKGNYFCDSGQVGNLAKVDKDGEEMKMNNKVSSVLLEQTKCENSFAVLYEGKRLKGKRQILRSSIADLSQLSRGKNANWNNAASSAVFSDKNAPECEVCVFAKKGYKGGKLCFDGAVASMKNLGMNNTVASLTMNTKDCKKGKAWLYNREGFNLSNQGGGIHEFTESVKDLDKGIKNKASSLVFAADGVNPQQVRASGGCRACMYDHTDKQGSYFCLNQHKSIANMKKIETSVDEELNFNNKTTSVQFIKDDCTRGEELVLELYEGKKYKGAVTRLWKGTNQLPKPVNNTVSSAKLISMSAENIAKRCRICMFSGKNYQGAKSCISSNKSKLDKAIMNKASSLKLEIEGCASGGALIYKGKKFKGDHKFVFKNYTDLKKVKRGAKNKKNWSNTIGSVKFSSKLKDSAPPDLPN